MSSTVKTDRIPKAEQSRRTRKLIIDTGIACIAELGLAQTSMQKISRRAGISRGPLHYHFEDRNDLLGAIAEALPQNIPSDVMARLVGSKTLEDRLHTFLDIAVEQHLGSHHLVAIELLAAARRDEALAAAVLPHIAESEKRIDKMWLQYGKQLGWDEAKMVAFRTLLVASLRGLAVDPNLRSNPAQHEAAVTLLKKVFLSFAGVS
ncbi:MAG: TetR/AcrR family transcriptional regulator [Litorimonas sp.]